MKIKLHIPTEQYGFCEVEVDVIDEKITDEIADATEITYRKFSQAFKPKPINSLPDKEFNAFIDAMLLGEMNHVEQYEKMSPDQIKVVQAIKRSLKRIKSKNE